MLEDEERELLSLIEELLEEKALDEVVVFLSHAPNKSANAATNIK